MRIYCNRKWRYATDFTNENIEELIPEGQYEIVDLPHTVAITELNYFSDKAYQKVSCYQKKLPILTQWLGKSVRLTFEGAAHEAVVYVNGHLAIHHKCGYTAFSADVSNLLKYGDENIITVRLDSNENLPQPPFGNVIDYMTYGGIYRDVYFTVSEPCHIEDIFAMPILLESVETARRDKSQIARIETQGLVKSKIFFKHDIVTYTREGRVFVRQFLDNELLFSQPVGGLTDQEKFLCMEVSSAPVKVHLWDVVSPKLYTLKTEILLDNQVMDVFEIQLGFRHAIFKADGFYLNNRKLTLIGLNRHQSYPYIGYAATNSLQKLDAQILKNELGVNIVRTSHYPQSQDFISECDRLGLLVFTEIPGWQHIGNDTWQTQAVVNCSDMVKQYRNHTSIVLWGIRINESKDDDELYHRTNKVAHLLDPTRQTSGVRALKKGSVIEDVYAYNDFSCNKIKGDGCLEKEDVIDDEGLPYLISEHNGHMFPTKMSDCEEHRLEQALRHARVLDSVKAAEGISGAIGWCMTDYNTHSDFGSGDKVCYHGVMDMWRNPKQAAATYKAECLNEPYLSVSTSMDIGEHPASSLGNTYIFSNAASVIMYKGNDRIKEYTHANSPFKNLKHGPILIDDFIGDTIFQDDAFKKSQAKHLKKILNHVAINGMRITPSIVANMLPLMLFYKMKPSDLAPIYTKYIGGWGSTSNSYHFDAMDDDKVLLSVTKSTNQTTQLIATPSQTFLSETHTYDMALVRIIAADENANQLHYFNRPITASVEGPVEIIGESVFTLNGGAGGLLIKSAGKEGDAKLTLSCQGCEDVVIKLFVATAE